MLFHSNEFLLFFGAFLLLYWLVRNDRRWRNVLIVAASYVFYGWWDWRLLGLLILSSVVDYAVGLALGRTTDPRARRRWLWVSVGCGLGVLGFFKYAGFFLESFYSMLDAAGIEHPSWTWRVILPVGISFYTFQTLSYTVDVYRRRIEPTRDLVAFLAFVSFFPQLVAGPIERAEHLLPQFETPRVIRMQDIEEGIWLILWGLFKKVVVADQLAPFVELAFDEGVASAPVIVFGVIAFAGQIYGDFSGYSDIAKGLARVLGFELRWNFYIPYGATSIRDFWRRWHISLSTWLRDYLYVPLGGNRMGETRARWNVLVTMLLGGLWHGAAWNFVLWGAWHGVALVIHRWWTRHGRLPTWLGWLMTLVVVGYGWMLFRCGTMANFARMNAALGTWQIPSWFGDYALGVVCWWLPLVLVGCWQAHCHDLLAPMKARWYVRYPLESLLFLCIAAFWGREAAEFIYFQF